MGDGENAPLRLLFNPKIRLEFHGATITSDAGLLPVRELDEALGLTRIATDYLQERCTGRNIQHHLVPLLRQSIYSRLAGYDDTNDADRLAQDPAMRVVLGWRGSQRNAASANTMSCFETELLTQEHNLKGLPSMNAQWVKSAMAHTHHRRVILDINSSEVPRVRCTATRKEPPTTATSGVFAFIPGSVSTSSATAQGRFSDQATCTAPMAGRNS